MRVVLALAPGLVAAGLVAAALAAATLAATAQANVAKPCGAVSGSGTARSHYSIYRIASDCGFARRTVASIVKQQLPNSRTPIRTNGPAGWVCVAQEVAGHVAVAGHCVQGRSAAISWVTTALPVG